MSYTELTRLNLQPIIGRKKNQVHIEKRYGWKKFIKKRLKYAFHPVIRGRLKFHP